MEADNRLILWALAQRASGNLRLNISRLEPTSARPSNLYDIQVVLENGPSEFIGRGTHENSNQALTIALSESFERTIASRLSTGSNGLAAHTDLEKAKAIAKSELIERDAFLNSYFYGLPVLDLGVDAALTSVSLGLKQAFHHIRSGGVEVHLYGIAQSFEHFVVMAMIDGRNAKQRFGINIGFGCDADQSKAVTKALSEIVRNGLWATDPTTAIKHINLDEFHQLSTHRCQDHLALALDLDYAGRIVGDLNQRQRVAAFLKLPEQGEFHFIEHGFSEEYPTPPLYVVQCINESLQGLSWGPMLSKHINSKRAQAFSTDLSRIDHLLPHPVG